MCSNACSASLSHAVLRRAIALGSGSNPSGTASRIAFLMVGTRRFGALLHSEPYICILLDLTVCMWKSAPDRTAKKIYVILCFRRQSCAAQLQAARPLTHSCDARRILPNKEMRLYISSASPTTWLLTAVCSRSYPQQIA